MKLLDSCSVSTPYPPRIIWIPISIIWLCQLTLFSGKMNPFSNILLFALLTLQSMWTKPEFTKKSIHIKDTSTEYEYVQFVTNLQKA